MTITYGGQAQGWCWSDNHVRPPAGSDWGTAAGGMLMCPVARPLGSTVTSTPPGMQLRAGSEVSSGDKTVGLYAYPLTGTVDGTEFRWDFDTTDACGAHLMYFGSDSGTVRIASFDVRAATADELAHPAPTVTLTEGGAVVTWCLHSDGTGPPTPPDTWLARGSDWNSSGIGVAGAVKTQLAADTYSPGDWTGDIATTAVTYTVALVDTPDTPEVGGTAVVEVAASAGITVDGGDDARSRMAVRVAPIRVANRAARIRTGVRARPVRTARKG